MQFPNNLQAAILLDAPFAGLEALVRDYMRIEQANSDARFNVSEANPGKFYRLFGGDNLMITFEYMDQPANVDVFRPSLQSAYTGIVCPDVRERITRSPAHILINVSHGVLGELDQKLDFLKEIGFQEGHSQAQFTRRLEVLGLICRIVIDAAPASLVHWMQSDMIVPADKFDSLAAIGVPGPLNVHPFLFGPHDPQGPQKVGIRTFGLRHFIAGEVLIQPNVLPWAANYEVILSFLRVALHANGYVIPDGDTFGPEDRSLSYRVVHRPAEDGDVPLFELVPLLYREFGFEAADHAPLANVVDALMPPPELMPDDQDGKMDLVNEWQDKRRMAEGIGGRFELRSFKTPTPPPPRPPMASVSGAGLRARVFGRKGLA
ncbi:MAG: hypothetical protein ACKOPO_01340 [Novosphingobium sp.]